MVMKVQTTSNDSIQYPTRGVLRDIPAMAVGDWIGAEQSNPQGGEARSTTRHPTQDPRPGEAPDWLKLS